MKSIERITTFAEKAQVVSYKIAETITSKMQPHTVTKTLILHVYKEIMISVIGEVAKRVISKVPL